MKKRTILIGLSLAAAALIFESPLNSAGTLPPLKAQKTPDAVVDEHLDALNKCDWNRLMAQYTDDAQFFLPLGQTIVGREKIGELFANIVKPGNQGGLCGSTFRREHTRIVGETVNVQWIMSGDFLEEPYRGSDAYETRKGLMAGVVTTFQGDQLKRKASASGRNPGGK